MAVCHTLSIFLLPNPEVRFQLPRVVCGGRLRTRSMSDVTQLKASGGNNSKPFVANVRDNVNSYEILVCGHVHIREYPGSGI
jgi:hypothetical protein